MPIIHRTSKEKIDEYFADSRLNQSRLKKLLDGPQAFIGVANVPEKQLYYEEKGSFIIGSGVDCIITQGQEVFDEQYYIQQEDKCSDVVKSILKEAFDTLSGWGYTFILFDEASTYGNVFLNAFYIAANNHNYYNNRKKDTFTTDNRYESAMKEGIHYWNSLIRSQGKIIIDDKEHSIIEAVSKSLLNHPIIGKYFSSNYSEADDIFYQLPIYFTFMQEECKALLDRVDINHKYKIITPIDIKTMGGKTIYFPSQLRSYRYDIQAFFYLVALGIWAAENYPGYIVNNPVFIVESTTFPGSPLRFVTTDDLLRIGDTGRNGTIISDFIKIEPIKGLSQLVIDYKWYKENGFIEDRKIAEAKNSFQIDWLGII